MQNTRNSEKSELYIAKVNYFYTVIIDASKLDYMRIPVSLGLQIPLSPGPLPFQIVAFLVSFVPSSSSFPLNVSIPQASAFAPSCLLSLQALPGSFVFSTHLSCYP